MSLEENKALIRRYLEQENRHKAPPVGFYTPDCMFYLAGMPSMDLTAVKRLLFATYDAFPDLEYTIDDMVAERDEVVVRGTFRGTHKGELLGIPPTEKTVEVSWIGIYHVTGGRIAEYWEVLDRMGLMQQLGATPE